MSFAVTGYHAYGIYIDEPVTTRAHQVISILATGTSADVVLDLANSSGTFWTAALADGTYGAVATAALAALTSAVGRAEQRVSWCCPEIQDPKVQIAAGGTLASTNYKITTTGIVPSISIFAGEGALSYHIVIVMQLAKEQRAVRANV